MTWIAARMAALVLVLTGLAAPVAAADPVVLGLGIQPGVAVDAAGTAYVAWLGPESSDNSLQFCRIPRGAAACDIRSAIPVPVGSNSLTRPFVHVNANGAMVRVVQHRYGFQTDPFNRLLLFASANGGATFAPGALIGTQGYSDAVLGPGDALSITGADPNSGQIYQRQPLDGSMLASTDALLSSTHIYDGAIANHEQRPVVVSSTLSSQGQVRRFTGIGDANLIANWSPPSDIGRAAYMRLAAGPLGLFQLATGAADALEVRRFTGTTFAPGHALAQFPGPNTDLVQDAGGRLHAFWFSGGTDGLSTSYAISDDGVSWQIGAVRIDTQGGWDDPDAAIAADHVGALVWAGSTATQPNVIKLHGVGPVPPTPDPQNPGPGPGPGPGPNDTRPTPQLPSSRDLSARARLRGSRVKITVGGRITLPPTIARSQGCTGQVAVTVKRRRHVIAARTTRINSRCGFNATILVPGRKARGVRKLGLTLRFLGNSALRPTQKSYRVRIMRRR